MIQIYPQRLYQIAQLITNDHYHQKKFELINSAKCDAMQNIWILFKSILLSEVQVCLQNWRYRLPLFETVHG